jgi:cell division protein FtsZ
VSVVATGIEQERVQEQVAPPAAGMAELTRRLKSVSTPAGTAAAHTQPAPLIVPQPQREVLPAYALESLEQELMPAAQQTAPRTSQPSRQASQARASADPSVKIGPFRPDPSLIATRHSEAEIEQLRAAEAARAQASAHFIPPAAERPDEIQARMPRVEDFPPVAQRQLKAQQNPQPQADEERRPRGLLARLTSGLTRRDEDEQPEPRRAPVRAVANQAEPRPQPQQRPAQPQASQVSEFAKPPQPRRQPEQAGATGNLDPRGRQIPIEPRTDDALEIPAFLRRQTS